SAIRRANPVLRSLAKEFPPPLPGALRVWVANRATFFGQSQLACGKTNQKIFSERQFLTYGALHIRERAAQREFNCAAHWRASDALRILDIEWLSLRCTATHRNIIRRADLLPSSSKSVEAHPVKSFIVSLLFVALL